MSDEQSGLFFTTTTDSKNREYLSAGDNATITGVGKETSDCSIVSLETSKDGSSIKVSIAMQGDDFLPGESAQMTATRKSESYDYLVPVTAVWQENNKAYVLLLETENTVLGEQYIARKAEVQILDKNSSYAAVSGNSLSADCQIITDSDRTVGNGDVVRMTSKDRTMKKISYRKRIASLAFGLFGAVFLVFACVYHNKTEDFSNIITIQSGEDKFTQSEIASIRQDTASAETFTAWTEQKNQTVRATITNGAATRIFCYSVEIPTPSFRGEKICRKATQGLHPRCILSGAVVWWNRGGRTADPIQRKRAYCARYRKRTTKYNAMSERCKR